jgi:WD40 repeat protein
MCWFVFLVMMSLLSPAYQVQREECSPESLAESRLVGGIPAQLIAPLPTKLYGDPATSADAVAELPPETPVYISSGPSCVDGRLWWQVGFDKSLSPTGAYFGWIPETTSAGPTLLPQPPRWSPPAAGDVITTTNLHQLQPKAELQPLGYVREFVWSPDSATLAISNLYAIWMYDLKGSEPVHLPRIADSIWNALGSARFAPDSQTITTVDIKSGDLHQWSLAGDLLKTTGIHVTDYNGAAALAPDLSRWAVGHWDGSISFHDAATGALLRTLTGHRHVGGLAFTPDGAMLISMGAFTYASVGSYDDAVRLWDVQTGRVLTQFTVSTDAAPMGPESRIAVRADGKIAAVSGRANGHSVIYLLDLVQRTVRQFELSGSGGVQNLAFHPNGDVLAVNTGRSVRFLSVQAGDVLDEIPFDGLIHAVSFSPDGKWLAVAMEHPDVNQNTVQLWGI